jgi:hypothetical protein
LDHKLPIKSVVIGPHQHQANHRMAVELILEKHGLDIPIRMSGIPFRE